MILKELSPKKALNKAWLKVKPNRTEIERFKVNLISLLEKISIAEKRPEDESEEHLKNDIRDFLRDTYYRESNAINTKDRKDLVIHLAKDTNSRVGVIIEAKRPSNKAEMITAKKLNAKAFQELVLYYLRERITHNNLEIKHLVATNIHEWFIFDAVLFDRLFAQNKNFAENFNDFEDGRLGDTKTDFFYRQIAAPFIDSISAEIEFTRFNLRDYQEPLCNADKADDTSLIALFKLLSPEHLLKLPFINDSNSLDKRFYTELLHIIGLSESKEGGKKLIGRNKQGERNTGTIIEDAMIQLDTLDKLGRLENPNHFGANAQEQLFHIALELSITWINRILFLKLLEAQLITWHKGDKSYLFLNIEKIRNYDDLNSLFFQVLARRHEERNEDVKKAFETVPYLNSSLFEPTDLEQLTLFISNLKNDKTIPVFSQTVLKDRQGRKRTGNISTLEYLFAFLDAYDFSSEGSEEIQEDNKTLINASVLGLIFEKINGYKDGSFFTPGFITMYMCKETIRRAVVQKFKHAGYKLSEHLELSESFNEIYNQITDIKEANRIVNSIKICDPAVGSGHFLVSALNEMIAVKNDLKILMDLNGRRVKEYQVEVENDELTVTEDDELFEYNPKNKESQRIQETLFHEKQTLIENCLFGVDINSNSVKICRLRLWIELLKNAYYKNATELETLPNIDINIKCGNSLVSRFPIDADLKQALKKSRHTIEEYRIAVDTYRNAQTKEQKKEMEGLIADIKSDFTIEISQNDPKAKKVRKLSGELFELTNQRQFFEMSKKEKADWNKKVKKLSEEIQKLETGIEEIKTGKIFENAFEWRFEFPEVLNDDGDFAGFDVVIGNPPYFIMTKNNMDKFELSHYITNYKTIKNANSKNIFNLFIELGIIISNKNSYHSMIVPEGLFETRSYSDTIELLKKSGSVLNITRIEGMVFDEANTGNVIFIFGKSQQVEFAKQKIFKKNQDLIDYNKIDDPVISKIDNPNTPRLSDVCQLFKGMAVADRKNNIFEKKSDKLPNKFLLGNCISKWKIEKCFYTDYESISIVGGTKAKYKHDVSPRILIRRTGNFLCCAYLTEPALTESTLYSCWSIKNDIHNLFILGVLHSKVSDYYIKNKLVTNPQAFPQILMTDLQSLPIPNPTIEIHDAIKKMTEEILKYKDNIKELEFKIDHLVYKLYDLNEEEIKIIESA